ncbi:MAG: glycoside hydrolase family 92 protein [Planctomycetes bacterium]|nr:glycoside hydrolase family 92 protein [Planctomycetota bacterium]
MIRTGGNLVFIMICLLALFRGGAAQNAVQSMPVDYVDPFIGTAGFGHTFPGATAPFGMVQLSPDTRDSGWENCSGYHSSNPTIVGFSHTHLSGTGCADMGDILVMPTVGNVKWNAGDENKPGSGYRSRFDHNSEVARPGFYEVDLTDSGVRAALTASDRCGMHRYRFNKKTSEATILFDLTHGIGDVTSDSLLSVINNTEIAGFRRSKGWAENQIVYFVARFSNPFDNYRIWANGEERRGVNSAGGNSVKGALQFSVDADEAIFVKVGLSYVNIEGARANLDAEIPDFDFVKIQLQTFEKWSAALSRIEVHGTDELSRTFYTAFYHVMIAPNLLSDVDGRYPGMDHKIHESPRPVYHVFSLWDTFRALHPLLTIVDPERDVDFIRSLLLKYKESGTLPVWELAANETNCMIGYHSIPVIVDAWQKGLRGFDEKLAFEAMKKSALEDRLGLKYYKANGYIPVDRENEGVSKALEYAYDDWCISEFARSLDAAADVLEFRRRAKSYINNFDPSTGFMRAKKSGAWVSPFDPNEVSGYFTEANSWQYSFFAPHDISGLIALQGGDAAFINKLELLFNTQPVLTGRQQVDISGLIGEYAHGNEPSHHTAYLYHYAGEPWRSQRRVHQIRSQFYNNARDGICGNDDCGQMSAWYVLSSIGMYPVVPGRPEYAVVGPSFANIKLHLRNGKKFTIRTDEKSPANQYIQSAKLNREPFARSFLRHDEIMAGGVIEYSMGAEPNKKWGSGAAERPVSATNYALAMNPVFISKARSFIDNLKVEISVFEPATNIYYTTDGSVPTIASNHYEAPFEISSSCEIRVIAARDGVNPSYVESARFIKLPYDKKVIYKYPFSPLYTAGGEQGLVDGVRGDARSFGDWQGFEGTDFEAVVDLGAKREIHKLSSGWLHYESSWIFLPTGVEYFISDDGQNYRSIYKLKIDAAGGQGPLSRECAYDGAPFSARFIKVVAVNRGVCPPGHPGAGGKSWIFVDEIAIE